MVVEMRTLRITSDFNAANYVAGMSQKVAADREGTQSSRAAGAAVEELKIKVSSAVPLIERLSRTYVDGYGSAARFNTEVERLARSQNTHAATVEHLELVYDGIVKKFGLSANASDLAARGYEKVATAIANVNSRLAQTSGAGEQATALAAQMERLRQAFDPAYVASQRLSTELGELAEAERLGVQITGGYESALDAIILKHDAAAAAAKRQREEYTRLAQEGREAAAAERAQGAYNRQLGVSAGSGLRASDSASVFAEQLGRQEEIARQRAQQQASNFAAELNSRFSSTGTGTSAQASASVFTAEFARQDEMARLRAQQQGSAFTSDLNDRLGVNGLGTSAKASAGAFEEAARAAEELDRKVTLLRAQINPLGAAQNRLNAELAEYEGLAARGAISTDELSKSQALARQRYDATSKEIERQNKRGVQGLPSYQATNLLYQGTDVVQSLALGMPLTQVLLQQGPQIAQIFYAAEGSMQAVLGLMSPIALGIGAVTAAVAVGALAWSGYLKSIKEVETAANGLGLGTAGSSSQLEAAAQAGAAAADISVKSARTMEAQFLRTGRIGSDQFEDLIAISKDFAATIGIDAGSAGEALAEMFANPARAAQTLYQQYGLIDSATARQVTNLAAQNRQSEAQAVLLTALPPRLASAAEATTALGRAWNFVSTNASNAFDWMGKAVDKAMTGPTIEERLAESQATRQRLSSPTGWLDFLSPGNALKLPGIMEESDLNEQVRRQNAQRFREQQRASEINLGREAVRVGDASGANSDTIRAETLRNEIAALRSGQGIDSVDQTRVNSAIEAKTRVLDALINKQQRLSELDSLDIQIQSERNPILRADLEARRTRLQLADQEIGAEEREGQAARARSRVIEETIASARTQAADMSIEFAARQRLTAQVAAGTITAADANRLLEQELSLRPLIAAAAAAEGAEKERLNGAISELTESYGRLADQQRLDAQVRLQTDLQFEREQAFRMPADQRIAASQRGANLPVNLTGEYANQVREFERVKELRGDVKGFFSDLKSGLVNGDSIGEALKNSIVSALSRQSDRMLDRLVDTLFGAVLSAGKSSGGAANLNSSIGFTGANTTIGAFINGEAITAANNNRPGGFSGLAGASSVPANDIAAYISQAASVRGIDPAIALKVARSEGGLDSWNLQSKYVKNGVQEPSFGPFQLYKGGGLGNDFMRKTGLDPALAQNGPAGVNFALDHASKNGWGAWYGAGKAGISDWQGIGGGTGTAADAVSKLASSAGAATKGLDTLGGGLGKIGQSLSTGMFPSAPSAPSGGGGGLFSWIGSLFGPDLSKYKGGVGLYDNGGYTGPGGVDVPRGVVHAGEIVWSQRDIARSGGVATVEAMRMGHRGYAGGGVVDMSQVRPPAPWSGMPRSNPSSAFRFEHVHSFDNDGNLKTMTRAIVREETPGIASDVSAQQIHRDQIRQARGGFGTTQQQYAKRKAG